MKILIFIIFLCESSGLQSELRVDKSNYKYLVYLEIHSHMDISKCTGTTISNKHVLTAGHCFNDRENITQVIAYIDENSICDGKFRIHPNYKRGTWSDSRLFRFKIFFPSFFGLSITSKASKNDIAIVTLTKPWSESSRIPQMNLAPKNSDLPYCMIIDIVGTGNFEYFHTNQYLPSLQMVIMKPTECKQLNFSHRNHQFCTVSIDFVSQLDKGDSGTPVVYDGVVYGVLTAGFPTAQAPYLFTKIANFRDFIDNELEN